MWVEKHLHFRVFNGLQASTAFRVIIELSFTTCSPCLPTLPYMPCLFILFGLKTLTRRINNSLKEDRLWIMLWALPYRIWRYAFVSLKGHQQLDHQLIYFTNILIIQCRPSPQAINSSLTHTKEGITKLPSIASYIKLIQHQIQYILHVTGCTSLSCNKILLSPFPTFVISYYLIIATESSYCIKKLLRKCFPATFCKYRQLCFISIRILGAIWFALYVMRILWKHPLKLRKL